jgi:hypothetical protein
VQSTLEVAKILLDGTELQFRELCREKGIEIPPVQLPMKLATGTRFDFP